jgi:hypothetical protein
LRDKLGPHNQDSDERNRNGPWNIDHVQPPDTAESRDVSINSVATKSFSLA